MSVRFNGPEAVNWAVPRDLLYRESEYFREMLEDTKEQEVTVDFIGAPVFRLYLQWLLAGSYHEHKEFSQMPSYRTACNTHTLESLSQENVISSGEDFIVLCVAPPPGPCLPELRYEAAFRSIYASLANFQDSR